MPTPTSSYPLPEVTGILLAGGAGRRMGGVDKGLQPLAGVPMAAHALRALRAQCVRVVIDANRNLDRYAALGAEVVCDDVDGFAGPLAGIASALAHVRTRLALVVPCDSPLLAGDLGPRLWAGKQASDAEIAVARDAERYHPVFALLDAALASSARACVESGERKIDRWFERHRWVQVDCSGIAPSFVNVNHPHERAAVEARLHAAQAATGTAGASPKDSA